MTVKTTSYEQGPPQHQLSRRQLGYPVGTGKCAAGRYRGWEIVQDAIAVHADLWPAGYTSRPTPAEGFWRSPRLPYTVQDLLALAWRRVKSELGLYGPGIGGPIESLRQYPEELRRQLQWVLTVPEAELEAEAALYLLEHPL